MINKLSTLDNIQKETNIEGIEYLFNYDNLQFSNDVGLYNEANIDTKIIVIPDWISNAIVRNKLDHIDILEYNVVQKIMAVEDIAQFLCANNSLVEGLKSIVFDIVNGWLNNSNKAYDSVIKQIFKMIDLPDVKKDVVSRLLLDNFDIANLAHHKLYQVELKKDNNIYIVVKAGFLNALNSIEFKKQFYSNILKNLYSLMPIHIVSTYPVFKQYLKTLKS